MKMLNRQDFYAEAGTPVHRNRDFSLYDRAPYQCACGSTHKFQQFAYEDNYASSGTSAKFVVQCPNDENLLTLIKTKNKFMIAFDRFVSLAGHNKE